MSPAFCKGAADAFNSLGIQTPDDFEQQIAQLDEQDRGTPGAIAKSLMPDEKPVSWGAPMTFDGSARLSDSMALPPSYGGV